MKTGGSVENFDPNGKGGPCDKVAQCGNKKVMSVTSSKKIGCPENFKSPPHENKNNTSYKLYKN